MNKALAFSILGMGLTGAVLILSVAFLFNPPVSSALTIVTAGALTAFAVFAISALFLRRRLDGQTK